MRFITFYGLSMIAKSIDPSMVSQMALGFTIISTIAIVIDVYELYRKWSK